MDKGIEALVARLNERYGPTEVPKCRLCAGLLSLQRSGPEGNVWACSGQVDDEDGWHYAPGRNIADSHYEESQWYDYSGGGDSEVMELIAALEQAQQRNGQLSAERDALRESGLNGQANTRAAADIYFQLIEEYDIQPGGSLVEHIDGMRDRLAEFESRPLCVKSNDSMREAAPLCVKLPDSSSKAFWSGIGKTEQFHPETYKRWVKESIERAGDIAGIKVEVK